MLSLVVIPSYLPNGTAEVRAKLMHVLVGLNSFEFGSFDAFGAVKQMSLVELEHINITELYRSVNHRCEELFVEPCWWRNKYLNCCTLFAEQKSEYGICYAFNSGSSPVGQQRIVSGSGARRYNMIHYNNDFIWLYVCITHSLTNQTIPGERPTTATGAVFAYTCAQLRVLECQDYEHRPDCW